MYVQNHLRSILGEYMGFDIDFNVPELTAAASNPAMAELVPLAEDSWAKALEDAVIKGEATTQRVAMRWPDPACPVGTPWPPPRSVRDGGLLLRAATAPAPAPVPVRPVRRCTRGTR
ncbi:hypothetical protein [Streptomyces jeddahensis]|uniref:Uncharacterized protein n=1 Tax=Streptomyces jeddahensis TaxID=1716141 RepID=A0A177HII4_9ACTN|nr:hypothetical protein [Streptomyces jeddahensis]OAH10771.1 hypothetical protein STSP_59140 [Streptomyces jeddahensis]